MISAHTAKMPEAKKSANIQLLWSFCAIFSAILAIFTHFSPLPNSMVACAFKVLLNACFTNGSNDNYRPKTQPRHCLDLKQIKQVIDLMKRSDLTEFEFEEEGF